MEADRDGAAFEVHFLEKVQRLLAEGDFSATYKFAVLLGLVELAVETSTPGTGYRDTFTTHELARRVLAIYWPQVREIAPSAGGKTVVLKQNSGRQANIVSVLADLSGRAGPVPIEALRSLRPVEYDECVRLVEWKLIEMPLPRLQQLRSGSGSFIYTIGWEVGDVTPRGGHLKKVVGAYQRGRPSDFDNTIRMLPGVTAALARLHGLVRQLVEARWLLEVRKFNREFLRDPDLDTHLFGAERLDLGRVRGPLREQQSGRCFYCGSTMRDAAVDHFLPWARYPDDRIENLVVAHARCNGSKSQHLASVVHLDHWLERFDPTSTARAELRDIAARVAWPEGGSATLAIAGHVYAQYPADAGLWHAVKEFHRWTPSDVTGRLDSAARRLHESAAQRS